MELSNTLIIPQEHAVVLFDWSLTLLPDTVSERKNAFAQDISHAARNALTILGANENGEIPTSDQLEDNRFQELLVKFSKGSISSAITAYKQFYGLSDELWEREFHPFRTYRK